MHRLAWIPFAVALASACGGDDGLEISTNERNVCAEVAEVRCHNAFRCCDEGEIEDFLRVEDPRNEAQCREDVQRRCERELSTVEWSFENKRVTFNAEAMNACLEAVLVPSDTCGLVDVAQPWIEACKEEQWVGTVADGGSCYFTHECANPDSSCARNRTCVPKPGENQPCSEIGCAKGLFCEPGLFPAVATCKKQATEGQPCPFLDAQCATGLFCEDAPTPEGMDVCKPLLDNGKACIGPDSCKSKNCLPGLCAGTVSQTCFQDSTCSKRCSDNSKPCEVDNQCSTLKCSVSGISCFVAGETCLNNGGTCAFPVTCSLPADCVGDPVCADNAVDVDYCDAAILPSPLPGDPSPRF